jgi:hypothetical protein
MSFASFQLIKLRSHKNRLFGVVVVGLIADGG